jgi:hypothetical protein
MPSVFHSPVNTSGLSIPMGGGGGQSQTPDGQAGSPQNRAGAVTPSGHGSRSLSTRSSQQQQHQQQQERQRQQAWDASTYHGLLAILKDPSASIAASCAAVEECLTINKDNLRGFFETCFAPLIGNVFGFDERDSGQGGWVNRVVFEVGGGPATGSARPTSTAGAGAPPQSSSSSSSYYQYHTSSPANPSQQYHTSSLSSQAQKDVVALRKLFAPKGRLFMAMYNADCDGTIKYHFPVQRLPGMSQMLLSCGHPLARVWPQYGGGQVIGDVGTMTTHVHVSVLQYFCYWFAYYATKSLSSKFDGSSGGLSARKWSVARRSSAASSASASASHGGKSMYLVLLRDLLQEFMPRPIDTREDEGLSDRAVMAANFSNPLVSSYQDRPGTGMLMYSILVEFWLKDACEPWLREGGGGARLRRAGGSWGASYDPPVENLLEAIEELTKYVLIYQLGVSDGRNSPAQGGTGWLPPSPVLYAPADIKGRSAGGGEHAGGSPGTFGHVGGRVGEGMGVEGLANATTATPFSSPLHGPRSLGASASAGPQAYARQLYRMMHRALSSWPDQRSIKPLLKVFMVVLEPWRVAAQAGDGRGAGRKGGHKGGNYLSIDLVDLVKSVGGVGTAGSGGRGRGRGGGTDAAASFEYTPEWEHHVLSHLPFYLDLVPMFLELSVSRVAARGEPSVLDVVKVLRVFERSEALVGTLQDVERDANRYYASEPRRSDGTYAEILPWVIDQAENWKRFARDLGDEGAEGALGGTAARAPAFFSMFTPGSTSVAMNQILSIAAGILKPSLLKTLQASFDKVLPKYEDGRTWDGDRPSLDMDGADCGAYGYGWNRNGKTGPVRKIDRSTWRGATFKGTELSKPRTSNEIPGLVDVMVSLSERINTLLTLDVPVSRDEIPETVPEQWLYDLRRRGTIVNLRPLADVRNVVWLGIVSFLAYAWWSLQSG